MADYLLDTNHLSPLVTKGHHLRRRVFHHLRQSDRVCIAVPALTELLYGILLTPRADENLQEWERLREGFRYYHIDRFDAERAASLQVALRKSGRQLATVDALIATIALRYELILLTTDRDFQAVPDLLQENWMIDS